MICQKCGKAEATVDLETLVFRQKVEEHLCALCAGVRKPSAIKVIEFTTEMKPSDFLTKLRQAEELLGKGRKVRLRLKFRGREMTRTEIGFEVIRRAIGELAGMGYLDSNPKLLGRNIHALLIPLPPNKRLPRFGTNS